MKRKIKIKGTENRPRLSVFKSNKNLSIQIINDDNGTTVLSASTLNEKLPNNRQGAEALGAIIAKKSTEKKIMELNFDRGRYPFKGRLKILAEAIEKNGVNFKKRK